MAYKINGKKLTSAEDFKPEDYGVKVVHVDEEGYKVVSPETETKSTPIPRLSGTQPLSNKSLHASKPWKPKGRK